PIAYMESLCHHLSSSSLFLDLGSGVGSVVAQVSLRTGCTSVGIELVPHVAMLAQDLMSQILFRCHMWGVQCSQIKVEEGDMLDHKHIAELIPCADVIFVNNLAFKPDLNEKIKTLLKTIKDGAKIISLKQLAPTSSRKLNQRTRHTDLQACQLEQHTYDEDHVSWTDTGGLFYVQTMDLKWHSERVEEYNQCFGQPSTQKPL
ncbi:S-adenosyl-L-methionine-dependent methyltransferase, partial [Tricholoma matsutake]